MKDIKHLDKVIFTDEYYGIQYWIIQYGVRTSQFETKWYCAYVQPPEDKLDLDVDELEVHGGITFDGEHRLLDDEYVWGWDYNHSMDYVPKDDFYKTKLGLKPVEEVIDIISEDCQEFIQKYLL